MRLKTLGLLLLTLTPMRASADITAKYRSPGDAAEMTVEIASNGDSRVYTTDGELCIKIGSDVYLILSGEKGRTVFRVRDINTVMSQFIASNPTLEDGIKEFPTLAYADKGPRTINGRAGTAFVPKLPGAAEFDDLLFVISGDQRLLSIGGAIAGELECRLSRVAWRSVYSEMQVLLRKGAPLSLFGSELQSVDFAPIPASRFILPKEPETLKSVRRLMMAGADLRPR